MQLPWGPNKQHKADAFDTVNVVSALSSSRRMGQICKISSVNNIDIWVGISIHHNDRVPNNDSDDVFRPCRNLHNAM